MTLPGPPPAPDRARGSARHPRRIVAIVLVVLALPIVGLSIPAIKNNLRMNDFKSGLFSINPPPGAEVVDRGTRFGLLDQPASNGCNYVAWLDLSGVADAEAVEEHYREQVGDVWLRVERRDEVVHVEIEQGREAGWDLRCT